MVPVVNFDDMIARLAKIKTEVHELYDALNGLPPGQRKKFEDELLKDIEESLLNAEANISDIEKKVLDYVMRSLFGF